MPALNDIAFECPECEGPLIAEAAHAGLATDCPHCYRSIEVPKGHRVNTGSYVEPLGLRRILEQVRDHEWEAHRRKLRVALAHVSELEGRLRHAENALAEQHENASPLGPLHAQLAEFQQRYAQVTALFETTRQQHTATVVELQRQLSASRAEAEQLRREKAELAAAGLLGKSGGLARSLAKRMGGVVARG
jgi:DNA repair exonuclease SbcCD ATPase subunit